MIPDFPISINQNSDSKGYQQLTITVPNNLLEEFKKVLFAGANLDPNLSPHMKTAVDIICNGKPQQDYHNISA